MTCLIGAGRSFPADGRAPVSAVLLLSFPPWYTEFLFLSKKHRYYNGNNSFDYNTCQERRIFPVSPPFHQSSDMLPFFPRCLHILPICIAVRVLRLSEYFPPFGFCQFLSRICAFCQLLDSFHTLTSYAVCCAPSATLRAPSKKPVL